MERQKTNGMGSKRKLKRSMISYFIKRSGTKLALRRKRQKTSMDLIKTYATF
jgi:hypothetical protein